MAIEAGRHLHTMAAALGCHSIQHHVLLQDPNGLFFIYFASPPPPKKQPMTIQTYLKVQDEDPAGVIPLDNCTVQFSKREDSNGCCFDIFTRYRTYFFRASSEVEASEWIETISHAKEAKEERVLVR